MRAKTKKIPNPIPALNIPSTTPQDVKSVESINNVIAGMGFMMFILGLVYKK
ncbi:MAG: hypothetical protein IPO63_03210 [Bacteroidetes bacterium]|nr:hypothetical protein [Bacteroidota bacterium]